MKKLSVFLALALAYSWLAIPTPMKADTLLSNLPTLDEGYYGEVDGTTWRGVTFRTSGTAFSVTSVTLNLLDYLSATDTAVLNFHLSNGSQPNAAVFASLQAPVSTDSDYANAIFTPLTAITLAANTDYWLVISASAGDFYWTRSSPSVQPVGSGTFGNQQISYNSGTSWSVGSNGPHTFAISGSNTIPEPAIALLFGFSLATILVVCKRRKFAR